MLGFGPIIVIIIRILAPLTVFKWRFGGFIIGWLADLFDVIILDYLNLGFYPNYTIYDKALDIWFSFCILIVAFNWEKLAKNAVIALFSLRLIGVVLVEMTQMRWLLFIFPNVFENFYFFWICRNKWFPKFELTVKKLFIILTLVAIPKLLQEYFMHVVIIAPWEWFKDFFHLRWIFGDTGG